ncbi:NUDIX hydrolase [Jatrophihabitans sp. YIM 134969]
MLRRRAARVVVLDRQGRVLLFRGGDPARPDAGTWWFTPGGGAEAGETYAEAAVREVREEAGLAVEGRLVGPVWERPAAAFAFDGLTVEQSERFYLAALDVEGDDVAPDRSGWTDLELRTVVEQRWWTRADLATTADTVYPLGLPDLLDTWLGPAG